MLRYAPLLAVLVAAAPAVAQTSAPAQRLADRPCPQWEPDALRRNATATELRCRFGATGPGRFGLLSYVDVPVYQPATPMPGTHVIGVPGHARPRIGESYEEWEWRVLRTAYGPEARRVLRGLELLDPFVASRLLQLEDRLAREGVRAFRRETWRSPERQEYLFQQGRSRPGPLATATLTSWHSHVDEQGRPAGRAADYDVAAADMPRFHEIARQVGLESFGADSFDPGHVYLPEPGLTPEEVALLRVLPRVPEVTLSTGLPTDRPLPAAARADLRAASYAFAGDYFLRPPVPTLAGALGALGTEPITTERRPVAVAATACPAAPRRAARARAAVGGAPCAPRRSEARSGRATDRNTGG